MTSNPSQPPAAVLLPRPSQSNPTAEPVWTVNNVLPPVRKQQSEGILGEVPPLQSRCAAHDREGDKCCKELKGDDERHLISPEIVRDMYVTRRCNSNVKADQACDVESSVFPTVSLSPSLLPLVSLLSVHPDLSLPVVSPSCVPEPSVWAWEVIVCPHFQLVFPLSLTSIFQWLPKPNSIISTTFENRLRLASYDLVRAKWSARFTRFSDRLGSRRPYRG